MAMQRRITRKDLATGSVSLQPRGNKRQSKSREARVIINFPIADVPMPVRHGLGFVPSGYTVLRKFKGNPAPPPIFIAPGDVYNEEPLSADKNSIVLFCTVAGTTAEILVR